MAENGVFQHGWQRWAALVGSVALFVNATSQPTSLTEGSSGGGLRDSLTRFAQDATESELDEAIEELLAIRRHVAAKKSSDPHVLPPVLFAHKHAYATADPVAAANFVVEHLGGIAAHDCNHTCPSSYGPVPSEPDIRSLRLNGSSFVMHFVFNPLKAALFRSSNATELGRVVDALRGSRWAARGGHYGVGHFDQLMDNHIGLAVASLDPYVRRWEAAGVPFICRTWCCAPGMPQWPHRCPAYSYNRTHGCEVGCYVEIPFGIMVELQCGFTDKDSDGEYKASLECLTHVQPEVFDLCLDERRQGPAIPPDEQLI